MSGWGDTRNDGGNSQYSSSSFLIPHTNIQANENFNISRNSAIRPVLLECGNDVKVEETKRANTYATTLGANTNGVRTKLVREGSLKVKTQIKKEMCHHNKNIRQYKNVKQECQDTKFCLYQSYLYFISILFVVLFAFIVIATSILALTSHFCIVFCDSKGK